jgi:hypothetical protein
MCTCVRARTHTHRRKRKCPTVARWHPTAVKQTADQMRALEILKQLADAADWRGVAAQERAARAVAATVGTSMPLMASCVYCTLGNVYHSLGNFSKAIEYHAQDLAIAKEVGDRAVEGMACANLGSAHQSQGNFSKAIKYHMHWQNCTWRTSPMHAKRTRSWHISKEHLSWRVQRGPDLCLGCGQTRGEDMPMLTCSGCRVARFCSADHQRWLRKKPHWAGV